MVDKTYLKKAQCDQARNIDFLVYQEKMGQILCPCLEDDYTCSTSKRICEVVDAVDKIAFPSFN